ncbi:MAG: FHA domain-containing protein [Chloroflexota bacterium]
MTTYLIVQRGLEIGKRYELQNSVTTIGRSDDNDISFDDPYISRYHAVIKQRASEWIIIDLGSENPVQIRDTPLEPGDPYTLQNRDIIRVGQNVLSYIDSSKLPVRPATVAPSTSVPPALSFAPPLLAPNTFDAGSYDVVPPPEPLVPPVAPNIFAAGSYGTVPPPVVPSIFAASSYDAVPPVKEVPVIAEYNPEATVINDSMASKLQKQENLIRPDIAEDNPAKRPPVFGFDPPIARGFPPYINTSPKDPEEDALTVIGRVPEQISPQYNPPPQYGNYGQYNPPVPESDSEEDAVTRIATYGTYGSQGTGWNKPAQPQVPPKEVAKPIEPDIDPEDAPTTIIRVDKTKQ